MERAEMPVPRTLFTNVIDLRTGTVYLYNLPPEDAVRVAFLQQDKKDYNTWNYSQKKVPVRRGKHTVACGNFAAFVDQRPI